MDPIEGVWTEPDGYFLGLALGLDFFLAFEPVFAFALSFERGRVLHFNISLPRFS